MPEITATVRDNNGLHRQHNGVYVISGSQNADKEAFSTTFCDKTY